MKRTGRSMLPIRGESITCKSIKGMTKDQWLELRSHTIGGSEMGSIMGVNGYGSAYSVYCERKGLFPAFEGNNMTEVGTYLEDFVARKFADMTGKTIRRTEYIWYNSKHPHLHASPDRLVIEKNRAVAGLEVKTTGEFSMKKVRGADFPLQYYTQCVQYMMVTELPLWYLIVFNRNMCEYHIFALTRDAAFEKPEWCEGACVVPQSDMDALQEAANDFWDCLETNTAPDPAGTTADDTTIKTVYADVVEGNADLWGHELLLQQYTEAKEAADAAAKEEKRLAQMIQLEMQGHEYGECMGYKVTYKMQPGKKTFDYKAAVAHDPELESFIKIGKPYRKFEVKKLL